MDNELTKIIIDNQNLIYKMTHYFTNYRNSDDLFQAGCMGIVKAYKNYDDSYNIKFTTYAYPYILGEMKKFIREDRGLKVSNDINRLNLQIEKVTSLLSQKLMHEPSIKEISNYLEIDESIIVDAIKSKQYIESIDAPITNDEKISLIDIIPDYNNVELTDLVYLREELNNLTPFEKELIEKRYFEDLTQSETSIALGISQVQVSRKEQKVLTKLKDKMIA